MDKDNGLEIIPNKDALKIYYDEYDFGDKPSYEDFSESRKEADIYGMYLNGELSGCIYFIKKPYGYTFHLAVRKGARGRWMFYYIQIKRWIKDTYGKVFTAARDSDKLVNSLLGRAGFEEIGRIEDFVWYEL